MLSDESPLPENFSNVADEDTWMKMNKGYVADLESIQTPARRVQSFPFNDASPVSSPSKSLVHCFVWNPASSRQKYVLCSYGVTLSIVKGKKY